MEFPNTKLTAVKPYNPWSLKRYWKYDRLTPSGRKWLVKELAKVEGGLDGITL